MIRIVADSSSLYSKNEGKEKGISIAPLAVNINGQTYKEFEDINTHEFIEIINKGHIPSSSHTVQRFFCSTSIKPIMMVLYKY